MRDWCEFFAVHRTGVGSNKKFASGKKDTFSDFIHVTRNSSTEGKCETHVLLFTSINYKRKHVPDQSIDACFLLPWSYVCGLFTNYKSPQQ